MLKKISPEEWQKKIELQKKSGKNQAEWCRENKISVKSFGYWSRKLRNQSDENQSSESKSVEINWIPVNIETPKNPKLNIKIGSAVIEIEKGFDGDLLSEVVKALAAIC